MLQKPSKHKVNKTQHGGYGWEHLQYFCIKLKSVWPLRDTVVCISWTDRATVKSLIGLETSRLKNLWLLLCWCFQNGSDKWHIYFTKKPSNSALSKGCTICFIALSDLNRVHHLKFFLATISDQGVKPIGKVFQVNPGVIWTFAMSLKQLCNLCWPQNF